MATFKHTSVTRVMHIEGGGSRTGPWEQRLVDREVRKK